MSAANEQFLRVLWTNDFCERGYRTLLAKKSGGVGAAVPHPTGLLNAKNQVSSSVSISCFLSKKILIADTSLSIKSKSCESSKTLS